MLFRWIVDPHFCWLTPVAGVGAPACLIGTSGGLVDISALKVNGLCGSAIALLRLSEFDAAMAVLVFMPIHKQGESFAALLW